MACSQEAVYSCQGCEYQDTEDMVQCDICSSWYHYSCAGPDITDDIANYSWNCRRCVINQFALTLVNDRQTMIENPVQATTSVNQKISLDSQSLALDYMEAKRLLDEEQLNRSFEIQRKFLRERFHILKLSNDEKHSPNEIHQTTSFVQKDNVTSRVHFDDVVQQVPLTTSTPYRAPSINEEHIQQVSTSTKLCSGTSGDEQHDKRFSFSSNEVYQNQNDFPLLTQSSDFITKASKLCQHKTTAGNQSVLERDFSNVNQQTTHVLVAPNPALTLNQIKEDSSPEWNKLYPYAQHVEQKHESLFVSRPNIKYQHLGLGDITNLGYPEISRETLTATNQPIQQSDVQNLIPQCNSHASITVGPELYSNQIAARQILPRDLPKFHGSPKEWPIFISSYQHSTLVGGYSNSENLIRLQRCLQGKAMDAVRSFLLTPENVPNVIDTLRMLYGRPELIIHSLVQQIREEQSPKMEKLSSIIKYALAVKNLCAVIESTQLSSHMNNPYLMQEILDKLPSSLKLEWSQYKRKTSHVTLISMGNWLYDIAKAASDVSNVDDVSKDGSKTSHQEDRNGVTGGEC